MNVNSPQLIFPHFKTPLKFYENIFASHYLAAKCSPD